jgi:hypothetical protein
MGIEVAIYLASVDLPRRFDQNLSRKLSKIMENSIKVVDTRRELGAMWLNQSGVRTSGQSYVATDGEATITGESTCVFMD